MLRNLIILILSIICSYSILYAQEQKVLLVGECSKSGTDKMLQYLEKNGQINLLSENNVNITKNNISSYPIIFVCNNQYLQLSSNQINYIAKHIKKGGLFIVDNITSDYTYSLFIKQLLPEFEKENIQIDNMFDNMIFDLAFEDLAFESDAILINNKIVFLGIKNFSLLDAWNNDNEEFLRLGGNIIFYYLTR
tara:strand:- start:1259 stop:1837 length:579 start_codon:yes stop_codon:yes gene_type:complete